MQTALYIYLGDDPLSIPYSTLYGVGHLMLPSPYRYIGLSLSLDGDGAITLSIQSSHLFIHPLST